MNSEGGDVRVVHRYVARGVTGPRLARRLAKTERDQLSKAEVSQSVEVSSRAYRLEPQRHVAAQNS